MSELLSLIFFRNALLVSLILGVIFGLISFFVVVRRMVFLGAGIAHMAFGGVALGLLAGIHPMLSALVFSVAAALLIGRMAQTGKVTHDAGIGILFSFSMALGIIFIGLKKAYSFDLTGYLFGNILGVTSADLIFSIGIAVLFIPFIIVFMQKLLFMSFDEPVAKVSGVPVVRLDMLLLVALAAIIVSSMKMAGVILVSALTVLPASFGLLFSHEYIKVILLSISFSVLTMVCGLFLSYYFNLPAGATIVVLGTMLYFMTLGLRQIKS